MEREPHHTEQQETKESTPKDAEEHSKTEGHPKKDAMELPDHPRPREKSKSLLDDFRTVAKATRIGEAIQLADQHIRDLGIICSISKGEEDKYIIGNYHQIAHWNRRSKVVEVERREFGGRHR